MTQSSPAGDAYRQVQRRLAAGWNTWDTRSVLTHVLLPAGLAVVLGVKEYYRGNVLRDVQIGRQGDDIEEVTLGPHAIDGSYTSATVRWRGIELHVESAHVGDDLVILVTPRRNQPQPATLTVSVGTLWRRPGVARLVGDAVAVDLPGHDRPLTVTGTAPPHDDPYVELTGPYLAMRLTGPVGVATGAPRDLAEIERLVAAARIAPADPADATAVHRELVRDAIAWNTIYEPAGDRVVTTVSRLWNVGKRGGWALFCWDNYFNALLAGLFSADLAYANAVEMTRELTPDGFVPNVAQGTGRRTYDGSQPPVGAAVAWQLYQAFGDRWFLAEVWPGLLSWNRWWWRVRRDGELLCLGSTAFRPQWPSPQDVPRIDQHFGATCESGCDDHPVFAEVPYRDGLLRAHDIGLNSEYVMDCEALAAIADVLGHTAERDELTARGQAVAAAVERRLWSEPTASYRSRLTSGERAGDFTTDISPMSFYPLLAGLGADGRAARMLDRYLRDERHFGGRWALPSTPRTDAASAATDSYWRARVWPPVNFLVYLGLRRLGRTADQRWLAERSSELALREWHAHRHVHENYSGRTGDGCDRPNSEPFHSWGALLSLVPLIEAGATPYRWPVTAAGT